ncbi:STAS domain-containing protein [Sphingomonas sp. S2-65]|uniref:STAS domain-containing protein n=1 Tax=Sphingomonas sp. S2-65 TaxID=2903960 RepID=UPI001F1F4B0F|nr:STAS domain-containing protein [Sphingomonas sp. S2-65]UYY59658.1 STAS domain-containing protein [Sphingomonas sp. S2-65]
MDSPLPLHDGAVRLPAHGTTVTADDLRVGLVLAADQNDTIEVDASDVESVGQAVLQLLVAARAEASASGQGFRIANPSQAFVERVKSCHLAHAVGLESGDAL